MDNPLDKIIETLAREHAAGVEKLTMDQFREVLRQAILSGDFMRCVQGSGQQMVYLPFQAAERLRAENRDLRERVKQLEMGRS